MTPQEIEEWNANLIPDRTSLYCTVLSLEPKVSKLRETPYVMATLEVIEEGPWKGERLYTTHTQWNAQFQPVPIVGHRVRTITQIKGLSHARRFNATVIVGHAGLWFWEVAA